MGFKRALRLWCPWYRPDGATAKSRMDKGSYHLDLTVPSLSANATITLPNATATLATKALTETLTNKTIDGDDNTLQDISPSSAKKVVEGTTSVSAVPSIPFVLSFKPKNSAGETLSYTVPTGKTLRVLDVRGYKANGNGAAGDTVTVKNATNAITDAIDLGINDGTAFAAGTYDDAYRDVAAGNALNVITAFNTDCACVVNVLCVWK